MYVTGTIWQDRNHVCGLPIGMSEYALSKHRLHLAHGFFTRIFDEVNLRYVQGITINQSIAQKLIGCGTVIVRLNHKRHDCFVFQNVASPFEVAELIHKQAMIVQTQHRSRVAKYYLEHPFAAAEMLRENPELAEDEYHQPFIHLCEHYL